MNAVEHFVRRVFEVLGRRSAALTSSALLVVVNTAPAFSEVLLPDSSAPSSLADTGLYQDPATLRIDAHHLEFSPQYPLWTDGATKRRWVSLPVGTAIDGSDPENWKFPAGTRLWKEFSFNGARVETRYMQLQQNGHWLFAAYAWSPDGRSADLVSARGRRNAYRLSESASHSIPGVADCKACHQGGRGEVLGFSALQLSQKRDVHALHAEPRPAPGVDLRYIVANGHLTGLPKDLLRHPPEISARTPNERIVLGYFHGNCAHCHDHRAPLQNLGLFLRYLVRDDALGLASTLGQPIRKPAPGQTADATLRVAPGDPDRSALAQRMASRYPPLQMPPLGTELVDDKAVSALRRWIAEMKSTP